MVAAFCLLYTLPTLKIQEPFPPSLGLKVADKSNLWNAGNLLPFLPS